jgi:DNA-binding transcriptional LysR family regulator
MDTALLETFRQVARHGSITGAARALAYTQSAVSRQVAALEVSQTDPVRSLVEVAQEVCAA